MKLSELRVGLAVTGSFCTLKNFMDYIQMLAAECREVTAIISDSVCEFDTRFSSSEERKDALENITGRPLITTVIEAEHVGPQHMFDVLAVAPCTGNTMAKLAVGITDNVVTMAVKSHLRNLRPVVIGLSSNDALGANAKNLGLLLNTKNIYFVPFYQDDPMNKEKSLTFRQDKLLDAIGMAAEGKQVQPLLMGIS